MVRYSSKASNTRSRGRIIVLHVAGTGGERRFRIESTREVAGGVLRVTPFAAGKLVAAINSKVQVYAWARGGTLAGRGAAAASADADAYSLVPECGFAGHTLAL
jgi:hypothetical protein